MKAHNNNIGQHRPGTTLDNLTRARAHPTTAQGWQLPMRGRGVGQPAMGWVVAIPVQCPRPDVGSGPTVDQSPPLLIVREGRRGFLGLSLDAKQLGIPPPSPCTGCMPLRVVA